MDAIITIRLVHDCFDVAKITKRVSFPDGLLQSHDCVPVSLTIVPEHKVSLPLSMQSFDLEDEIAEVSTWQRLELMSFVEKPDEVYAFIDTLKESWDVTVNESACEKIVKRSEEADLKGSPYCERKLTIEMFFLIALSFSASLVSIFESTQTAHLALYAAPALVCAFIVFKWLFKRPAYMLLGVGASALAFIQACLVGDNNSVVFNGMALVVWFMEFVSACLAHRKRPVGKSTE